MATLNFIQHPQAVAVYIGITVQNRVISHLSRNGIKLKSNMRQGGVGKSILACTARQYNDSCSVAKQISSILPIPQKRPMTDERNPETGPQLLVG